MLTDWLLMRRAADEIEKRVGRARVRDVGVLPDGRVALALWSRGATQLLCFDVYGSPPVVTMEGGELPVVPEPGFVRALGAALRGTTLLRVRTRPGDRLLRLDFSSRSTFGIAAEHALIVELVPRFGNLVLAKNDIVLAAQREFSLADNGTRAVESGRAYQLPPLDASRRIPKSIAQHYPPDEAAAIVERLSNGPLDEPLYVYRREGTLLQTHLVPIDVPQGASCTREPSLLALFDELRGARVAADTGTRGDLRKQALLKTLRVKERKLHAELAALAARRTQAEQREALRDEGAAIYATLHERDPMSAADEKDRAAKLFARYKKLGASLPHIDRREAQLRDALESIEALTWEAERADALGIVDVADAVAALDPHRERIAAAPKRKKRALLTMRTASGSHIVVGRTPLENAEITFRVARPNDLWFHVQGQPGAHVVLQRDDRSEPPAEDLMTAATLAAAHSKARGSARVAVDYTLRKYVRKRPNAAPGLVFYTNPSTLTVSPGDAPRTQPS